MPLLRRRPGWSLQPSTPNNDWESPAPALDVDRGDGISGATVHGGCQSLTIVRPATNVLILGLVAEAGNIVEILLG